MNLDWLIIGGGIHGTHIAARLIGDAGVAPERLRIVDPADRLLSQWRRCTEITGMTHLRSPSVHHLDLNAMSLQRFAGKRKTRKRGLFAPPYNRPALTLFNAHCDHVVKTFGLADLHIQERATSCLIDCDGVRVGLSGARELASSNVVLALGSSEQPAWPTWAPQNHNRVHHVFESGFGGWPLRPETVAVIGGGISASQVALRMQKQGHQVHLISRHSLRRHQFDSDPGWLGPKYMTAFQRKRDLDLRRKAITEARHRGSVPPDIHRALRRAISRGSLQWHESEIKALHACRDGLELRLCDGVVNVERVLLATGFASHRPGGAMVDQLVTSAALPCAGCGYPIVDSALRWHPRIYVSGPLAELELGPASRNIAGARQAGNRLVASLRSQRPTSRTKSTKTA